jgi:hypothetical protein
MATALGNYYLTLADWIKRVDPNGVNAEIVELLNQTNQILWDMPFQEGNLTTGHRTTVRTGLPSVVWSKLYKGIVPSKSGTQQVDDTCGTVEARSEIDTRLARLNGGSSGFIANEQLPFIEAMNEQVASGMFYFDTALNPEKFLGLAARYPTSTTANVINAGSANSGYLTDIWLICWGPNTVHGIAPKGIPGGLQHEYKGIEPVRDSNGGTYYAHVNTYEWNIGLCVRDWRYIVRLCNLNAQVGATTNTLNLDMLVDMLGTLPTWTQINGRPCFYMHKALWTQLMKLAMNKTNAALGWADVMGHKVLDFWGIPIRQVDQLLLTQSAI